MRKPREVKEEGGVKLYKCSSCGEFLPRDGFPKNLSGYDFISSQCKKCSNARVKKYRQENREKRNKYQKNYKIKRAIMYENQFGDGYRTEPIPEPSYPQPAVQPKGLSAHQSQSDGVCGPQPIPEPQYPQPGPQPIPEPKKVVVNFEEVVPLTFSNDDELIIQSAIEKYPDAYTEILGDEDTLYYFNDKRSTDKKIEELQRRQEKYDKQKAEREYNIMKEKMRDLVDTTLSEPEKIRFEDKLHSLHEEQQDDFVKKVSKLSKVSFPVSREAIFDALLDRQTGKNINIITTEFTL